MIATDGDEARVRWREEYRAGSDAITLGSRACEGVRGNARVLRAWVDARKGGAVVRAEMPRPRRQPGHRCRRPVLHVRADELQARSERALIQPNPVAIEMR